MTSALFDRRHSRRASISEHGIVSARVRPGHLVAVIDISTGGASIEMTKRLLPGAAVDMQFETAHRRTSVRGRVLRCAVIELRPTAVFYRAAIAFDRQWPCFAEGRWTEYLVPAGGEPPAPSERVGSTHDVV